MSKFRIFYNILVGVAYVYLIVDMFNGNTKALYYLVSIASLSTYTEAWAKDIERSLKKILE